MTAGELWIIQLIYYEWVFYQNIDIFCKAGHFNTGCHGDRLGFGSGVASCSSLLITK